MFIEEIIRRLESTAKYQGKQFRRDNENYYKLMQQLLESGLISEESFRNSENVIDLTEEMIAECQDEIKGA